MIKLTKATIHKYKSIENSQDFMVEPDVTVLVGMNESGKTSILEALAKFNPFDADQKFKFNTTHDYPRKQKKTIDKSGENPSAVTLFFEINGNLVKAIETDLGVKLSSHSFSVTKNYANKKTWSVNMVTNKTFAEAKAKTLSCTPKFIEDCLDEYGDGASFENLLKSLSDDDPANDVSVKCLQALKKYFVNQWETNPIDGYIVTTYLLPNLPKFMYYDDYYMLPSEIELEEIGNKSTLNSSEKTAKALLELADIDVEKITDPAEYEDMVAELEATQAIISSELFKYWSTNNNLKIQFNIESVKVEVTTNKPVPNMPNTFIKEQIINHRLNIRVQNQRSSVSLPLGNRSKGFNWFFSFLVWFKKIQENKDNTYILLLDEPGLNLHAKAQSDLLRFLTDLSDEYQVLYTTHSPFMIETSKLSQVRTVVEKEDGTHISESVQEKDPNTLFPLQAAIGYDLAQNLFISPKNLIVEGIADLVYLNLLSGILQTMGKAGLKNDVTIVPVGGADKVATFVSLLRGNELDMVCLLDTFTDHAARQRLENLIAQNLIKDKKVLFYHDILKNTHADIEDLFLLSDYLQVYNAAMGKNFMLSDFDANKPILPQLKKKNNGKDFNHYLPANYLAKNIATITLSDVTIENFVNLFAKINKLL